MQRKKVLFPEPLGPKISLMSPFLIFSETSFTASTICSVSMQYSELVSAFFGFFAFLL